MIRASLRTWSHEKRAQNCERDRFENPTLTQDLISKFRYRELQRELEARALSTDGTTSQLRSRLREIVLGGGDDGAAKVLGTNGSATGSAEEFNPDNAEVRMRKCITRCHKFVTFLHVSQ